MSNVAVWPDPVAEILAKGSITAEDVLTLRRSVFQDGLVDTIEAESVFRLDQVCAAKDPAWTQFYVDALIDFFVWRAEPTKYVSEDNAKFLIDHIVKDGRVDGASELELLINVIHWAESCPEILVVFGLEAVRESVLDPDNAAYGKDRRPGVVDAADVEIIRKVIYAGAGGGSLTITRREAELLFDLNRATDEAGNAESWNELFVKAIASYLMFPRGAPEVPSAAEVKRREAWLEERRGVGGLLAAVGRSLGKFEFMGAWKDADMFGTERNREVAAEHAAREQEALARESVTESEARWLIERIDEDGRLSDNERALLGFIKLHSTQVDPLLIAYFDKAGI